MVYFEKLFSDFKIFSDGATGDRRPDPSIPDAEPE